MIGLLEHPRYEILRVDGIEEQVQAHVPPEVKVTVTASPSKGLSQICFDPAAIQTWIARVRARGTDLPIWIGMPGVVDNAKLLRISARIGLGESARFLRAHRAWLRRLVTRTFTPDPLVRALAACVADPAANVGGFHFYTFNEVERTERWRRATIARLEAA